MPFPSIGRGGTLRSPRVPGVASRTSSSELTPRKLADGWGLAAVTIGDAVILSTIAFGSFGWALQGSDVGVLAWLACFLVCLGIGTYRSFTVSFRQQGGVWLVRNRWWTHRVAPGRVERLAPRNASLGVGPSMMAPILNEGPIWFRVRGVCIEAIASPRLDRLNENIRRVQALVE